ncbi:MAG TPA: uroporphyrinogen-III synthase, partial [Chlamydiales bacterium]|nr:uroporphyrinogen-III synthase [Chlamydiales bacterium]
PQYQQALTLWPQFSHVIFTSQTSVHYWPLSLQNKIILAIGEATARAIQQRNATPLLAPAATQEGVIALLKTLHPTFLFLPHSRRARPHLAHFLQQQNIHHFLLPLYDTHFQKPEPVPDLNAFDEIIFTSPSTVEGFLRIYGHLPKDKKLTPIGPITMEALSLSF